MRIASKQKEPRVIQGNRKNTQNYLWKITETMKPMQAIKLLYIGNNYPQPNTYSINIAMTMKTMQS